MIGWNSLNGALFTWNTVSETSVIFTATLEWHARFGSEVTCTTSYMRLHVTSTTCLSFSSLLRAGNIVDPVDVDFRCCRVPAWPWKGSNERDIRTFSPSSCGPFHCQLASVLNLSLVFNYYLKWKLPLPCWWWWPFVKYNCRQWNLFLAFCAAFLHPDFTLNLMVHVQNVLSPYQKKIFFFNWLPTFLRVDCNVVKFNYSYPYLWFGS